MKFTRKILTTASVAVVVCGVTAGIAPAGASATGGSATAAGCAANDVVPPVGAGQAVGSDLDGDGRADTIWLADRTGPDGGLIRTLGVRTASGAGFTTTFTSASPVAASAVSGRVGGGTPIILLDFTRSAVLYTVKDCSIQKSLNVQGNQYTFDRQLLTGYGTGAGCPVIGDTGRQLVGYKAVSNDDEGTSYTVTRTTILLSDGGRQARNGTTVTLGRSLSPTSTAVRTAQAVSCGANPKAFEPA